MLLQGVAETQLADETFGLLHVPLDTGGLGSCDKAYMMVDTEELVDLRDDSARVIRAGVGLQVVKRT